MRAVIWTCGLAIGVWWLWPAAERREVGTQRAAVHSDGFAVIEGDTTKVVHELDENGVRRHSHDVAKVPRDTRIVGSKIGSLLVWKDGRRVVVASADDLSRREQFGKNAYQLCAQTATNEHRFGVAWTENDGEVWFVHGPTSIAAEQVEVLAGTDAEAKQPDYCGIASAADKIALLTRTGDKTQLTKCGRNCSSPTRVAIPKNRELLGFGCTQAACVIVAREDGTSYASWVANNGKIAWTKPLPDACGDTTVSVVGAGPLIAIAYSLGNEPVVRLANADGELHAVWQGGDPDTVPSLAWGGDRLLVAFERDGKLATAVVKKR